MRAFVLFVLAVLLARLEPTAEAQTLSEAARNTQNTQAALDRSDAFSPADNFANPSSADADLGEQLLLTKRQGYQAFSINANWATTWTNNAFYTPGNRVSDVFMNASVGASALPHLGNNFFLEATARVQGYRYFRNPSLDFNSVVAGAGLLKMIPEFGDVGLYARYQYTDLFSPRGAGELLHQNVIMTGARKGFQLTTAQSIFLSAEASFNLGGMPNYALASQYTLFAAHQIQWTKCLQSSLYYQMQTLAFAEGGRADFRNNLGISFNLQPYKWLSIYSSTWLGWNASNQSEYNFFAANLGGGLGVNISF